MRLDRFLNPELTDDDRKLEADLAMAGADNGDKLAAGLDLLLRIFHRREGTEQLSIRLQRYLDALGGIGAMGSAEWLEGLRRKGNLSATVDRLHRRARERDQMLDQAKTFMADALVAHQAANAYQASALEFLDRAKRLYRLARWTTFAAGAFAGLALVVSLMRLA